MTELETHMKAIIYLAKSKPDARAAYTQAMVDEVRNIKRLPGSLGVVF